MTVKYAIFDLDNCISADAWRIPRINWHTASPDLRYAGYHAACGQDEMGNADTFFEVIRTHTPIFFTARPTDVREQTLKWLTDVVGVEDPILFMRNKGDHRHSVQLKREQLDWLFHEQIRFSDVKLAYDDRPDVVEMYRSVGIDAHVLAIHDVCAYTPPHPLDGLLPDEVMRVIVAEALQEGLSDSAKAKGQEPPRPVTAGDVLGEMAATFRERQSVYKDNYKMVAKLVAVLFPSGVPPELVVCDQFHLFELALVKLSRYAISNLTHIDSAHDGAVYLAMCEAINRNNLGETK